MADWKRIKFIIKLSDILEKHNIKMDYNNKIKEIADYYRNKKDRKNENDNFGDKLKGK